MPIDANKLSELLGIAPQSLRQMVQQAIEDTCVKIGSHYPTKPPIRRPTVKYDLKGRTAGYAINGTTIRVNLDILKDPRYTDDMLNQTIPHEVCHIACSQWYKHRVAHGYEWQVMMLKIGLSPDRCHQYEVKRARKTNKFKYTCDCSSHWIGTTRHNKAQQNPRRYKCKLCGSGITWTGEMKTTGG